MYNQVILKELAALTTEWDIFNGKYHIPENKSLSITTKKGETFQIKEITNGFIIGMDCLTTTNRLINESNISLFSLENIYSFIKNEFNSPRKFSVLSENERKEFWFETRNHIRLALPRKFTNRIDLINNVFYFADSEVHKELPTLGDLVSCGVLTECLDYKSVDLNYHNRPSKISVKNVQKFFKAQGFNVTEEAILHNFQGYLTGYKCGYRDEVNGYHLFTPSRLNNLSFRLTSLSEFTDWQTTYQC